jgi:demethylmenaquinone methyltransferase/2-methoxy-6-polyprenyl-1,4-benzoquinol methylase
LRSASTITAVDAAPEMLAIARERVPDEQVQFVQADLFAWRPPRTYDTVFFGFWLSHVPRERFDGFWRMIAHCLVPGGRVFFMDDRIRTPGELVEGESSSTIVRRTVAGEQHRIVKVPHVASIAGGLYWGSGGRAHRPMACS